MDEIISKSAAETQALGRKLARDLSGGEVICLYGELGAGKTEFVKGLANGLGFAGRVLSPTFVFIRPYKCREGLTLYHVDLYRVEKSSDAASLGLEDVFNDKKGVAVIEWAERIKDALPRNRIDIFFECVGESERKISTKNVKSQM